MRNISLTSGVVGSVCLAAIAIATPSLAKPVQSHPSTLALADNNSSAVRTVAVKPGTQVICSATNPLAGKVDGDTLALKGVPADLELASNVLDIFCRDVRINTIVVRHYCTVVQK